MRYTHSQCAAVYNCISALNAAHTTAFTIALSWQKEKRCAECRALRVIGDTYTNAREKLFRRCITPPKKRKKNIVRKNQWKEESEARAGWTRVEKIRQRKNEKNACAHHETGAGASAAADADAAVCMCMYQLAASLAPFQNTGAKQIA